MRWASVDAGQNEAHGVEALEQLAPDAGDYSAGENDLPCVETRANTHAVRRVKTASIEETVDLPVSTVPQLQVA